jgi:uncharacterized protein (DUF885 family)
MRANVLVVHADSLVFKEKTWQRHRAKFVGLLETDFNSIIEFTHAHSEEPVTTASQTAQRPVLGHPAQKTSFGPHDSYDMLPLKIQEAIVQKLVAMNRLMPPIETRLASLAPHYAGVQQANDGRIFYRFFIRSRMYGQGGGPVVFNSEVLVCEDDSDVIVRE